MQGEQALRRAAEAEAALRAGIQRAAQEWERTFDSMETPILIVDSAGRLARLNRAARDLAGSSSYTELLRRPVAEVGPGQPWLLAAEIAAVVERTRAASHGQVTDRASGRTWELTASPSPAEGGDPEQVIVVARDVTGTVELQESLRRSETMSAMGSLVAGVAHEVRNPLFGISANLDAFESQLEAGTPFRPFLNFMRGEVERLTALMQDLLDYGRPAHAAPTPGDLAAVVAEAVDACGGLSAGREVAVANRVPAGLALPMDRKRLVQVFQNILQNAIQLSPTGGTVSLEGWAEDGAEGRVVVVTVSDSGPGFAPDDQPRAFEPFFSRRRGGTGMGLAIVQRIVEAHRGTVSAGNRLAGGAVITVRLPAAAPGGSG
jgi:PAS domain S-box-containing protein